MQMPGRINSSVLYRYGFNGKENDNDVKGTGNQQDYGMRIYDPRLGRFLSVDPLTSKYLELTPYQFASNTPIKAIDLDGLEAKTPEMSFGERLQLTIAYGFMKLGELGNSMQERDGQERGSNASGFSYAVQKFGDQLMLVHGHLEMEQSSTSGPRGNPTASSTIRTQGEVFSTTVLESGLYRQFAPRNFIPIGEQGAVGEAAGNLLSFGRDLNKTVAPNFKAFDFFDAATGTATSSKTFNLSADSYMSNPRRLLYAGNRYIRSMVNFTEDSKNGFRLTREDISSMRLHIHTIGSVSTAQRTELVNIQTSAAMQNISTTFSGSFNAASSTTGRKGYLLSIPSTLLPAAQSSSSTPSQ